MNHKLLFAMLCTAILMAHLQHNASAQSILVNGHHAEGDAVGPMLVYSVKEHIRRSAQMTLAMTEEDAGWRLTLMTLNPDSSPSPLARTAYSLALTTSVKNGAPILVDQTVGMCGALAVASCATQIVARIDNTIEQIGSMLLRELRRQRQPGTLH